MASGIVIPGRENVENMAKRIAEARTHGALYHATNPADAYYCVECCVFGKGGKACWSCDSILVEWQYVPRWGGGAQSVCFEDQNADLPLEPFVIAGL